MQDEKILLDISKELGIEPGGSSIGRQIVIDRINNLITSDFQKLVSILYRIDVSEVKLKQLLKESPGMDAAVIITDLMIQRQEQKNKSRQEHKRDENINDDEKW